MRKKRLKTAIGRYVKQKHEFTFAEIYEHLNSSRATQVTTAQLGSVLSGFKNLYRVKGARQVRNGYEESCWEYHESIGGDEE
tara:strand:- start:81 stop:326 length:246 start_codon:yes stop_codon:yes gene_type:complete